MNITDLQNKTVQIEICQATLMKLKINNQSYRFDFINKREFKLKQGTSGELFIYNTHPLLIDHNEFIETTYINSKPIDFTNFIEDFKNAIIDITQGWRNWESYVTHKGLNYTLENFFNIVKNGSGKLIEAPLSISQNIIKVCNKHNVRIKTFQNEVKVSSLILIMISDNYVIAEGFQNITNNGK